MTTARFRLKAVGLLAGSLFAVFLGCGAIAWSRPLNHIDAGVIDWIVATRAGHPGWTRFFATITRVGNEPECFVVIGLALGVIAVLARLGKLRLGPKDIAYWSGVGLGGVAGNSLLKRLFDRQRPPEIDRLVDESSLSFPSGHSVYAGIICGLLAAIAFDATRGQLTGRARWGLSAFAVFLALLIGLSRVWLAVHYPSDVVGGLALGFFVSAMAWEIWIAGRNGGAGSIRPSASRH